MKTYCSNCGKTSLNLLHKPTGTAYCSNCGAAMAVSINIINAIAQAKLFLPDDFFEVSPPVVHHAPQARHPMMPAAQPLTPQQAAAQRRADMQEAARPDDKVGGLIKFPKTSREKAAQIRAQKQAALAQQSENEFAAPRGEWFKNAPNIARDLASRGIDANQLNNSIISSSGDD